ncbi:hypothetical protein LBMAG42_43000 [Deltaproteobacteria bacterium]|nr:hypothetical protein LBMAG42_43000 [Deltaproteobacteria bacterium]
MVILAFFSCAPEEAVKTCAEADTTVADDAVLDLGFTVMDLVASANLESVAVNTLQGQSLTIALSVLRAEGDAVLVDKTIETEIISEGGPGRSVTYEFNDGCRDEVTVPVTVALTDEAGAVNIQAEGTLYTADDGTMYTGVTLDAAFDPVASTLPSGYHGYPTVGALHVLFLADLDPELTVWVTMADGAQEARLSTPGRL